MMELVALVPAAGHARRLGALPCSKEILPVAVVPPAGGAAAEEPAPALRVACHCLLELLVAAGAGRGFFVLRTEKWDVARFLGSGDAVGLPLAYLALEASASLPASLDRAYPFVRGARVALGFPDVQLGPSDALARVAARQRESGADLVLGLFPTDRPATTDMVELDGGGRVRRVEVRPASSALRLCWLLAVWGPAFTEHLHRLVAAAPPSPTGELQIGEVVRTALDAGLDVRGIEIPGGWFRDLGTAADLAAAWSGSGMGAPR
jgi:glucose-1-phosphate thymidylyltransferase